MSGYLSALPRSLGGSRRRSGPSAAEARAALELLMGLTEAASGGAGGAGKADLDYLSVRPSPEGSSRSQRFGTFGRPGLGLGCFTVFLLVASLDGWS